VNFDLPRAGSFALTAALTPIVTALLIGLARRPAKERDGWKVLRPTVGLYVMTGLCWFLCALFAAMTVIALLVAPGQIAAPDSIGTWVVFIALAPPLTALFAYGALYPVVVRVRFNATGIERRLMKRTTYFPWSEVSELDRHWFFGPRFRRGRHSIVVWEMLRGFPELVACAEQHGVPVKL
jgi:hypothetical protein